ncbi:MAG: CapA family protein, partial [Desulfobacterales bacterium]|nr:CapA family protein [Desulfobacterales bacterium]
MHQNVDWEQGLWQARPTEENRPGICLGIAGDWAPIRAFDPIIEADPQAVYGDLLPQLTALDLSLVNLEAPLADTGRPVVKSGAVFKGMPHHVAGLTAAGFNAVTLANNHVFDFGRAAFDQTLETLEGAGIEYTGAGDNLSRASAPLILERDGIRLAILNFSEGEDLTAATGKGPGVTGWEPGLMEKRIQELKGRVHCIIVIAHCGIEYVP